MPITISDVAARAGVSKSTVSRYINGQYGSMGAATKDKIARIIGEMDYQPNALARSLKKKRTNTIGAIVANVLNPFSTAIIRAAEGYCHKAGFSLVLCNAEDDPVKERHYIEVLLSKQIDGLMITTTERNNELLKAVKRRIPMVLVGRNVPEVAADTIIIDSVSGVKMAIDHLVAYGHRKIAMFTLPYSIVNTSPRITRVNAFKTALAENGLDFREDCLVESGIDLQELEPRVLSVLRMTEGRPTALFCGNDLMTMAVTKVLIKNRIRVPDDVALIGFDDWEWAPYVDPPATVVAQPTFAMGERAAELLIKRIRAKKAPVRPSTVIFEPRLIVRNSCGER